MQDIAFSCDRPTGLPNHYVALIRGINVGGHSIIKMAELRKRFESFGFTDVATYIHTGNVLFSTKSADGEGLSQLIELRLTESLGRQMRVFVLTPADLKKAADCNPFDPVRRDKEHSCYLMFLSTEPEPQRREALIALRGEEYRFHVQDRVLYYAYSREYEGHRRTIDFEKVLGVTGTARSWKVVNKLIELSG